MNGLMVVDLQDMVVIDLWNAGEGRQVLTFILRWILPGQPVAAPGTARTQQRALKAGIPVSGRGLWHTGQQEYAALNALESLWLSGRTIGVIPADREEEVKV